VNGRNDAVCRHADPDLFFRSAPRVRHGNQAMQDNGLVVQVRREPGGHAVITVAGEVDIASVTRLRERLFALADDGRPLIVDLDQVSFIDAAGLGALAGAARRAGAHGASLHVVCARPRIRPLFRLTGLDRPLRLARTLPEAVQALGPTPDAAAGRQQHAAARAQPKPAVTRATAGRNVRAQ
jgi:anti-sigma B factor antagonist